ncbi:TlpA family protein disulfide reductase [Natranaerobius thermophilus]|uniref:Redoxin domain protein n=1 Tax=Natranaerobius thermophilus (strain ATCC BAA-1301 / DSM 18059 / JW/NM-WN-LF) TaxID=457570 RepID=B2A241_NATTJ|nr:TlpA disulfide reductase family protein [Natranaerobius thermophilus]ACB84846.1 Redoxin domain protein [Natranaerobius thermophilus JW/NM-WN-LF]
MFLKKSLLIILLLVLMTGSFLLSGCNPDILLDDEKEAKEEEEKETNDFEFEGTDDDLDEVEFEVSSHTLQNLDGDEVTVPDDLEDIVLIKFWQSTCPLCLEEMDATQKLHDQVKEDDDMGIYTINVMEDPDEITSFMENEGYKFPVLFDSDGDMTEDYQVVGFPVQYLVNQDQEVLFVKPGPMTFEEMESLLQQK